MLSIKHINVLLLLLAVLWGPVAAQNNPYKIDDSLYPLYQRASKWCTHPEGIVIADTLYAEAVRKNDKKAQCLALTIPLYYYKASNKYDLLQQAAEKLKVESRKNNYLQYYYFACSYEINWLLSNGYSLRALQKAEEMRKQAFEDKDDYGIFTCIRTLGNVYFIREDEKMAAEYYKKALDYMLQHLPDQDPSSLYLNLARYYRGNKEKDLSKALKYGEEAVKTAKTDASRMSAMLDKCQTLYFMQRVDEFNACYEKCKYGAKSYGTTRGDILKRLRVYELILNEKYEQALLAADSLNSKVVIYQLRATIYQKMKNYERVLAYDTWIRDYQDSINQQIQSSDLAELNAQIGNERMKLEAKALEYENTKLSLTNTQLELEHTKSQAELEKINAENNRLTLENRNLELARLNEEAEKQKAILKEQQIISQHRIVTLSLIASFLFLFLGFLIFYLYRRRKTMSILREKNNELTIARDRAEGADRMKTYFIQNMSHEIRTPLNAIVGFSQILATPEMELDDDEKKEFSMLIQNNSDLLTTLVNDILDLASLESGKYAMSLAPISCNELCRTALGTVKHRNPENVELCFTSEVKDDFQITTDGKRVLQVLTNYLTNAEKHTKVGKICLHCSLNENPDKITFSVTDTGSGVPVDKADSIFERFNKLDDFTQGTGLGLNICSIIAERLGGEVKLDKSYTKGARFLFILPL